MMLGRSEEAVELLAGFSVAELAEAGGESADEDDVVVFDLDDDSANDGSENDDSDDDANGDDDESLDEVAGTASSTTGPTEPAPTDGRA